MTPAALKVAFTVKCISPRRVKPLYECRCFSWIDAVVTAHILAEVYSSRCNVYRQGEVNHCYSAPGNPDVTQRVLHRLQAAMTPANHCLRALLRLSNADNGEPLDFHEPSPELIARITADWDRFREAAEGMGFDAVEHRTRMIDRSEGDEWDYAAHDFILTRNRHGAGFWDGDWCEPWGDRLTELAQSFGEIEVYVGDDGRVYA